MQIFACYHCKNLVWFENDSCLRCGSILGFSREAHTVLAFVAQELPDTQNGPLVAWRDGATYSRCATHSWTGCGWVLRDAVPGAFCDACGLTRTRPTNDDLPAMTALRDAEAAKRWVIYQLDELGLPVTPRSVEHPMGLAFDLLSSRDIPVTTGHADGLITLDLAEGDDAHREAMREQMAEPYRTVLGHFRHEIGHFYWDVLIADGPDLDRFRELFGDERADYGDALTVHYEQGPPADWEQRWVSAYATTHPWEDWAETFAHVLHITDTLQTASAVGLWVGGPDLPVTQSPDAPLAVLPPDRASTADELINSWLPLSYALNAIERSMGKADLYPFVLAPDVLNKLAFVFDVVKRSDARLAALH